jgi:predicted aspartyl protease
MSNAFVLFAVILFTPSAAAALQELPVLAARSAIVDVEDGDRLLKGVWRVDPSVALDVYVARRTTGPKRVTFRSDVAELGFDVEPGRTYDFVILLGGKDACRTRIATSKQGYERVGATHTSGPDGLPMSVEHGKLHVRGRINGSRELDLILDTGADIHVVYPSAREAGVELAFDGETQNVGTGGATLRRTSSDNRLELGALRWNHEPFLFIEKQADSADGIVGFDVFDGKVVEFDWERMRLVLHDGLPSRASAFTKTTLTYSGSLPAVEVGFGDGDVRASGPFVLDTGGTGTMNVNQAFAARHAFFDGLEKLGTSSSSGVGSGTVRNAVLRVPTLTLAGFELANVPIHVELPADGESAAPGGVVCMDVLRRFDLLLDGENGAAFFKPNRALGEPFETPRTRGTITVLIALLAAAVALFFGVVVRRKSSAA